ncbi:RES domain-containing protein [Flavobacterium undicola]|uniref:RES domain-containing protein n=1 Tax=Flavobacterium undicola TaxID=1932779 RepID=UPI001378E63C|nr:RES domain-containing protein [Flavobacterium undicola]MBA0884019.1 RES domain-containing protein [Flavobacterium undicola]
MEYLQLSDLSLNDLKEAIRVYQSLDFNVCSISDADKQFRLIIKHFIIQTIFWDAPIIYRARKHTDKSLFKNVEELIYPKNPTTLGRLNNIGQPLFYGASDHNTAIFELRPKRGDEITVLESRIINSVHLPKFTEVGIRELLIKQNHSPEFIEQNKIVLAKNLMTEDNKKRYNLINNFLVSEITKIIGSNKTHMYKGTIAIAQFYLDNKMADGMVYPSISRSGTECIAMKPESYHRFYRPDRSFKCKIVNVDSSGGLTVRCVDNSTNIDRNGNITWT